MKKNTRNQKKKTTAKPVTGTKEWAPHNLNIQIGCSNDCLYCYAKQNSLRFKWKTRDNWEEISFRDKKISKGYRKRKGAIMFPTTHDITKGNLSEYMCVAGKLLAAGNDVLMVSKPDPECIEALCDEFEEYKKQILFRFTISSANDEVLKFWEPNAPSFEDRLEALKLAHERGYQTSVSGEPMIDNQFEKVVDAVSPYVTDAIWIGLPNRLKPILSMNCGKGVFEKEADELLGLFTDDRIMELYELYKDNPKIKWKESMKKRIGLEVPTEAGLDI